MITGALGLSLSIVVHEHPGKTSSVSLALAVYQNYHGLNLVTSSESIVYTSILKLKLMVLNGSTHSSN